METTAANESVLGGGTKMLCSYCLRSNKFRRRRKCWHRCAADGKMGFGMRWTTFLLGNLCRSLDAAYRNCFWQSLLYFNCWCIWTVFLLSLLQKNVTGLSTEISGLASGEQYTGQISAENIHGSSIYSNNVSFTGSLTDESDSPESPHSLELVWNKLVSANVTWKWSGKNRNKQSIANYSFIVSFVAKNSTNHQIGQPAQVFSKKTWAELKPLEKSRNYEVHVTAVDEKNGKQSETSEIITFSTIYSDNPPSLPLIDLSPSKEVYFVGDQIKINCSSTGAIIPKVTLTIPSLNITVIGTGNVSQTVTASVNLGNGRVECVAEDGRGKTSRRSQSIHILFEAVVKASGSTAKVLDGLPAQLDCSVKGNPIPSVNWYFDQLTPDPDRGTRPLKNSANFSILNRADRTELHAYRSTLNIEKVYLFSAGYYTCKACNNVTGSTKCSEARYQLIVEKLPLPNGPTKIKECCKERNVMEKCQSVCTFDIDTTIYQNIPECVQEFPKLLHCAKNGIDHTHCCAARGVTKECMRLCDLKMSPDGDEIESDTDLITKCSAFAKNALDCVQEGQKKIPGAAKDVVIRTIGDSALRVSWSGPEQDANPVQTYVVYYKPAKENKYKTVSTSQTSVDLKGLKANTTYELTVLAANDYGFSQFSSVKSVSLRGKHYKTGRSTAGDILGVISCLLFAAVIILGIIWFTRRRPYRIPAFFSKLRGRHGPGECVAFENPGYDREGQIRGLPGDRFMGESREREAAVMNGSAHGSVRGSNWEQADLETTNDSGSATPLQKGLRYTQMTT